MSNSCMWDVGIGRSPDFCNLSMQMSALLYLYHYVSTFLLSATTYLPPNINVTSSIEMLILDGSVSEFLKELHRTYISLVCA